MTDQEGFQVSTSLIGPEKTPPFPADFTFNPDQTSGINDYDLLCFDAHLLWRRRGRKAIYHCCKKLRMHLAAFDDIFKLALFSRK